jgi:AraC-like DNA-binding protein
MLSVRTILSRDGLTIADVACRHEAGTGEVEHYTGNHSLVLVRRGYFIRSAEGVEAVLDPSVAYCISPGEEQRYDHPGEDGDDCTVLGIDDRLLGQFSGTADGLPSRPVPTGPAIDLEHRLLLAAARRGRDYHELVERALTLIASTVERAQQTSASTLRSNVAAAREALVACAREALAADPDRSLPDVASELAVSPHHLSRVFRSITGHTLARHRMRLRARLALERLADGERDLARLAAETGFADQSHLCRVIRSETDCTPGALRHALS